MNIKMKICAATLGLAVASGALAGKGNMGDHDYACQVQTDSQIFGLVNIQADSLAIAQDIATQVKATNVNGEREGVQHVIECIQIPGDTFADKEFWKFFQEFPR